MTTNLSISVRTDIGCVRKRNEDAYLVADLIDGEPALDHGATRLAVGEHGALVAVSDGMGGHKAGDVASRLSLESLFRALRDGRAPPEAEVRLVRATEQANADVYRAGRRPSLLSMGATVTAVLVDHGTAYVAEVGDSRAYLVRGGEIHPLTVDQSFAQIALDAGAMTEDQVNGSPLRNLLAQAMGQELDIKVAVSELALRARDCLLLCTDGLTRHVKDDEIRDQVLAAPTLAAAAESLVELAKSRGGEDNVTAVLVGVSGDVSPLSPAEPFDDTFRVVRPFR